MEKWNNKKTEELFKTILGLSSINDAKIFFRDLLTEKEIMEFANRWEAAKMLSSKIPYAEISESTGLSSKTVARISKWLNSGMGGYKKMIKKTARHHKQQFSLEKGLR
jgi:TrpR-related protein YerC/YecD